MENQKRDAALMELYALLTKKSAPKPGSFSSLDEDQRREYFTTARRRNRQRERTALKNGAVPANTANIREALADAALMILATDAPGAAHVRSVLDGVFAKRPGVPISIETRAKNGRLRPKLIRKHGE